ncbi:hypothetical protein ZWY2020_059184 [Hordeum vulgare]|nr:hypothetical protein ZWY2020_059184 [Hordeum vulgare]
MAALRFGSFEVMHTPTRLGDDVDVILYEDPAVEAIPYDSLQRSASTPMVDSTMPISNDQEKIQRFASTPKVDSTMPISIDQEKMHIPSAMRADSLQVQECTQEKCLKHAKYEKNGLPNFQEIHAMFAMAHVIGETSSIPREISENTNDHDKLGAEAESEGDGNARKEVIVSLKEGKVAKEGKASLKYDKVAKNVKRKAKFIDESAKEDKNPFLCEYKATLGNIYLEIATTRARTSVVPTMKEVPTLTKECGAEEGNPLYLIATDLVLQPNYRELFMLIETKEGRLDWLNRKHDRMNK